MRTETRMLILLITYFLIFIQMDFSHCETYGEYVDRISRQMCPYETFCSRNATKALTNSKLRPCCLPCSCEKVCISRNNCCPDYIGTGDDTSPKETCLPAAHIKGIDTRTEHSGTFSGIPYYHTIASCPSRYPDQTTVTRCTIPIPEDFIGAVRVSDDTGRVYRNRYCAICHGITNYKPWELRIKYITKVPGLIIDDYTKSNVSDLLKMGFQLLSLPPKDHRGLISRCYLPNIVACNQTGLWTQFNGYLQRACNSYTLEYIETNFNTVSKIYKNHFCFLCNTSPKQTIHESCEVDDYFDEFVSMGSFTLIIDLHSGTVVQPTEQKSLCSRYEIHDPYFAVCKPLYCPIGTQAWYGRCINLYKMTTGMSFRFPITINVTINDDANYADRPLQILKRENADALRETIIQKVGASAKRCQICDSTLYQFEDQAFGSLLFLLIDFSTTKWCTTNDMFQAVTNNIERRTFLASFGNMSVTIATALHYGLSGISFYDHPAVLNALSRSLFSKSFCTNALMISQSKFQCPNMELTNNEYQQLISSNLTGSPATYEDFIVINQSNDQESKKDMYRICIMDYLRQTTSSSGGRSSRWIESSVLIVFNGILTFNNILLVY